MAPSLRRLALLVAVAASTAGAASFSVPRPNAAIATSISDVSTFARGGAAKARAAAASAAAAESGSSSSDKTSLSASTFNLIKACVGSGVLALPAGVAAMGDSTGALVPASALVVGLAGLSAYSFALLGRLNQAGETVSTSLGNLWENEIGESSSWLVTLSCFLTPLGAALAFSIMLGDMISSLSSTVGLKGIMATRQTAILAISSLVIWPLCNLKSLAALAPVSMVAVAGIVMTCVFMYQRMASGAYAAGGIFFDSIAEKFQPSFDVIGMSKVYSPAMLVLLGMAATAYLAHFSALDFHNNLEENNMKRFGGLVAMAFAGTALINVLFMSFGFLTFGGSSSGLILNNYSTKDIGATFCRLVTVISLIGSYPIFFRGIKSSYLELALKGEEITEKIEKTTGRMIMLGITALSLVIKNPGFVVGFTGAIMGSAIIYIFPPMLYLASTSRRIEAGVLEKTKGVKIERMVSRFIIALGAVVGVLCGIVSVLDSFFPGVL